MADNPTMKTLTIDGVTYVICDDAARQSIGDLSKLNTASKTDLVAAINEAAQTGGSGGNSGGNVDLDTTLTQSGKAADAKAVGDKISEITGIPLVEPAEDDIPKVFFGGTLQQTKDEKVVPFRYISKTEDISGYAEIKAQGNSSMDYPKKNQTVKLFKDEACEEKLKVDFKGWGKQNKHVYKANWIDLSHARNVVSARLWADVVRSRANYMELPELLRTSPNVGAVDGFPVKVYADGIYQGRYTLNIPKDKWTFNMDDDLEEHCVLCGENYASGCFRASAQINESDWTDEIHDVVPTSIKTRWNEVISFVMNSTDEEFRANLGNYFYVDSLIDYELFGLASCGLDAFGKNQIYATYDGHKWIASMYDMDSTWGLYWNGSKIVSADYARTSYEDRVSNRQGNLLYIRLEQLFSAELQTRWAELKQGALSIENIINRFERFTDIATAELVKEDYASTTGGGKFTGIPSKDTNNIQQIRSFALARQAWTDAYLDGITPAIPVPCTGITLDKSALTFNGTGAQTITATVTPDGCTDIVTWESNNTSVATVNGGVVTAIANGNATITARCGNYSASCSVSVSGIVEPVPCTGISLDKSNLTFNGEGTQTLTATVTPDGCTDAITWESNNTSVATVDGGVVNAIANGNATITAKCGNYSASCSVAVSGIVDESILYMLPSTTEFNGTDTYIDTGVSLFDTAKDFTVVFHADLSQNNNAHYPVFHCCKEADKYPGLAVQAEPTPSNGYGVKGNSDQFSGYYSTTKLAKNESVKCCITCVDGIITAVKCKIGTNAISNLSIIANQYTQIPQTTLLGCYQTVDGTKGRFWKGTIYDFRIYNRALSDEEMNAYLT